MMGGLRGGPRKGDALMIVMKLGVSPTLKGAASSVGYGYVGRMTQKETVLHPSFIIKNGSEGDDTTWHMRCITRSLAPLS